jgi:hypothetical protein
MNHGIYRHISGVILVALIATGLPQRVLDPITGVVERLLVTG